MAEALKVGTKLHCKADGIWYSAEVLAVSAAPRRAMAPVKVHYLGYEEADEWVPLARLRSKSLPSKAGKGSGKGAKGPRSQRESKEAATTPAIAAFDPQSVSTSTHYRTHTCGALRLADVGKEVTLSGWVQISRDMNHFAFVDLRDRYGITQCVFTNPAGSEADAEAIKERYDTARKAGREWVLQITGKVVEREKKNADRATGDVEVAASSVKVLRAIADNVRVPFKIEKDTDANEDVRMKYRYLDIRRDPIKDALIMRNKVTNAVRAYLGAQGFLEVETPILIKSTPEGARDFVVPSRMNPEQFYALPQSPQTFKQLLMVGGIDRYFQIARCFRDEELRADRQPEFTQIDCEMAFVEQEDILNTFEGLCKHIFKQVLDVELPTFQRMTYDEAMSRYGIDKPDLRFGLELCEVTQLVQGRGFQVFDDAEYVVGITCPQAGLWSTKDVKKLEAAAKSEEIGASGLVWVKCESLKEGEIKLDCSAKKFFSEEALLELAKKMGAEDGALLCLFAGKRAKTQEAMGKMRNKMAGDLGLRTGPYKCLWVVDFPLLEWDEEEGRWFAMHHPFTSPKKEHIALMDTDPGAVRADAYDMVINGVEVGGGSIRIHEKALQNRMFELLGFTKEAAQEQFGFLLGAFEFGPPPHAGLAYGLDRMCQILGGGNSIRDYIAFPKNNKGRDVMIESPSLITEKQLAELSIRTVPPSKAAEGPATSK